jgi:MGT family glycosyltransferase
LAESHIDLMIVDQNEPAGGTVAEYLELPFINICPSLPLNREPEIPPPFVGWDYRTDWWARLRNGVGYRLSDRLIAPIGATVNRYRSAWGLPRLRTPDDSFSSIAQLSQMTVDFDFPHRTLPDSFHYLGPFIDTDGPETPFPYERLNGKPIIYASLGTLQDSNSGYFRLIAEACADINAQLVIATGGARRMVGDLPGTPLVVDYAPQLQILSRARLAITHAGLNTVMQSLAVGVPMVALPITHDQPAIAARVKRCGVGEVIPASRVTAPLLRAAVRRVLSDPAYQLRAAKLKESIERAGGLGRAAAIVEDVLSRFKPGSTAVSNALRNH